jgi:hypothetical protein
MRRHHPLELKLVIQIIELVLLIVAIDSGTAFDTFKAGLALRAGLVALSAFVFVTRPADGESTLVAGNERLTMTTPLLI